MALGAQGSLGLDVWSDNALFVFHVLLSHLLLGVILFCVFVCCCCLLFLFLCVVLVVLIIFLLFLLF